MLSMFFPLFPSTSIEIRRVSHRAHMRAVMCNAYLFTSLECTNVVRKWQGRPTANVADRRDPSRRRPNEQTTIRRDYQTTERPDEQRNRRQDCQTNGLPDNNHIRRLRLAAWPSVCWSVCLFVSQVARPPHSRHPVLNMCLKITM